MKLRERNLEFDFINAIEAFKFDEEDKNHPCYHGLSHCMKAVDFIAEYPDYYLFVEVKDPRSDTDYSDSTKESDLVNVFVEKFRDSFIYRWAEDKLEKPIRYYCFLNVDNGAIPGVLGELKRKLPTQKTPARWGRQLVEVVAVLNEGIWNDIFPDIPVKRLS